jgi:hypothetical protein
MATVAPSAVPQTELVSPTLKPQELSFPLPKALHTTGHVHLTFLGHCALVHLATSTPGDSAGSFKPMGSFVYAMPDVSPPFYSSCPSFALSCLSAFNPSFKYAFLRALIFELDSSSVKRLPIQVIRGWDICHSVFSCY